MSLEEKAKTGLMIYHTILHETKGGERFQDHPWAKEEWVLVSDAQQEIDKLKTFRDNAYKKWCELQQKIEHLGETLPLEMDMETGEVTELGSKRQWREWLVKFKEMLK
jgi:hypothetical protein